MPPGAAAQVDATLTISFLLYLPLHIPLPR
jgi:hypothetical protein